MIEFLENIGDYFSQHFFDEDFPKKVFDKSGYGTEHIKEFTSKIAPISEKYYKFKNDYLNLRRTKDKVLRTHQFHTELLEALGYINGVRAYDEPVVMDDNKIIPVRYRFNKNDKPYLYIMEMQPMIQVGDVDADGLYEQSYIKDDWEKVLPNSWDGFDIRPEVIKEALSELFLLPEEERPVYLIMLAGPKIFLIQYEKWKFDSYLLFDLEELFTVTKTASNRNLLALFYALLAKKQFISETESILTGLEEDAHKASYGVTVTLKSAVIYAVEALANEAIEYRLMNAATQDDKRKIVELRNSDNFARELKDECLNFVYRLLFLFYAESREDLEILPMKDSTYQKGYSLEMLRDLEMVALTTESSRNGYFFSESLWKLFDFLHTGSNLKNGFQMRPLDSPLFDNDALIHLQGIQFSNKVLQEIVVRLSLSERTKNKGRGRISYSNLGINQLGSVYESLLSYSGFFAREDLIEVKSAKDKNGSDGTFLVPKSRRDDFKEAEILKDCEHLEQDVVIPKGQFVYRLNGRDRKNSASYYTPEVLTQCTVKYTLKGIIEKLKEQQAIVDGALTGTNCADEILKLKILEPAMGAAAFHNEVINQLAVAYLELKENEEQAAGRKRITPGVYKDELQKVKAYIAANNVYGVDLNPTAVELGKLSLWLNCMHKNMETPFFAHRLGAGNAVVGAWLKVYNEKDCSLQYPKTASGAIAKKPLPKPWWDKAPKRVLWKKDGTLSRKQNQIYHFLLADDNMVPSYGIKLLKEELTDVELTAFKDWRNEFKQPLTSVEITRLQKISSVIDYLLEEHYKQQKGVIADTSSVYQVYGQPNPQIKAKGYDEKERLAESRKDRSAPYYKLKLVLDYWCSLWFWDVRDVRLLPSRTEWYNEIESILQIDSNELTLDGTEQNIKEQIRKKARAGNLFDDDERIKYVEALAQQHRFFHNEIEFIEVFKERGGFDVIVGNPPWLKLQFEEKGIMGESFPELEIRKISAPKIRKLQEEFLRVEIQKEAYFNEYIAVESAATFMNGHQNYPLLKGQQTNLYKCVLENGFSLMSMNGFMGLIHPIDIFNDSKGKPFRKVGNARLKYYFNFRNELMLFSEVSHTRFYSICVYEELKEKPNFKAINNLFHPSTIGSSLSHNGSGVVQGMKIKDENDNSFNWNTKPHKSRVINFTEKELRILSKTFGNNTNWQSAKLVSVHASEIISILQKIGNSNHTVLDFKNKVTVCWDETNDLNAGHIIRITKHPKLDSFEMVYSGPHFFVGNPLYKTPREICTQNSHYDIIDHTLIDEFTVARTNYVPANVQLGYETCIRAFIVGKDENGLQKTDNWLDYYKLGFRKMVDINTERSLASALFPPKTAHIHGVISIIFKEEKHLLEASALTSSLIYDFFVKTIGSANLSDSRIQSFPLGVPENYKSQLISRTLTLNCINNYYADLWERNWNDDFNQDSWSKADQRLKPFDSLTEEWKWEIPLRNWFERRQALVEIDVITAMALGLSLEELVLMYNVQFPVLQQNEDDTWYDTKGNIVFTVSKGLVGVGLDRGDWNAIAAMKAGETYEHTITKSELYQGKKITYYAPFAKCDRVEDYKTAWAHFEELFNDKKE
ncbi:hypothetical protein LX77_03609 [Gelidibacter algens]|uniref:site-specific DNA-methyltransferase (adenine-specific) n=1 Tax=Gelidibacter algens TaxID=49280 RepID=A0A1A7QZL5_9FLAO|nr:hypothetical protein [Gelidibacter algens]OBX24713.1 hypothetical protein A9996_13935 [Gelidibacter algens]RAJ19156.1 hypothetical protein LX77_03609 [Gelidibacter algens]